MEKQGKFCQKIQNMNDQLRKFESVLLSFLPVITLTILTSTFISSAVFHSFFSVLISCLWTVITTMRYLFMFMNSK